VVKGQPGGVGYKAQNNTQTIFTDRDSVLRFQNELIAEHLAARNQESANRTPTAMRQRKPKLADLTSGKAHLPTA
jgi:hypothetical protein